MATTPIKLTALDHIGNLASEDILVIDDVSALVTYKVTIANVATFVSAGVSDNLASFAAYANANAASLAAGIESVSTNFSLIADQGVDNVEVGIDSLRFSGVQGIRTKLIQDNVLEIELSNTLVTAGSYGGVSGTSVAIPTIEFDDQGRAISASESTVNVDFGSIEANVDSVSSNVDALDSRVVSNTFYSYNVHSVVTSANVLSNASSSLGDSVNPWYRVHTSNVVFGDYTFSDITTSNVNSLGAIVFKEDLATFTAAKLLVTVKDLTYQQTQCSEILVIHDGSSTRAVEYGIVHTSTNPIATFDAIIESGQVRLIATALSSDNLIKVLKITN